MAKIMPMVGDKYLVEATVFGAKPKYGTQLLTYRGRKYRGCQLHGDFMGYDLLFRGALIGDCHREERIFIKMDEKDQDNPDVFATKVYEKLGAPLRRAGYFEE